MADRRQGQACGDDWQPVSLGEREEGERARDFETGRIGNLGYVTPGPPRSRPLA